MVVIAREHSAWHAPLLVDAKQTTPQTARHIKQHGDKLKSAAARYAKLHQEAVPGLALACAGVLSEPIRDRAARSANPCCRAYPPALRR